MTDLKPCAHCGGPAKIITCMGDWVGYGKGVRGGAYGPNRYRVVCAALYEEPIRDCPGRETGETEAEAITAWNTRAPTPVDAGLSPDPKGEQGEAVAWRSKRCPRCDSPDPAKHPAVQLGGEVQICPHGWHGPAAPPSLPGRGELAALKLLDDWGDNWIIAKGKLTESEPPYAAQLFADDILVSEGEGQTLLEAVNAAFDAGDLETPSDARLGQPGGEG